MADIINTKPSSKEPPDPESGMQRRLMLAIALTGIVFFASQFFLKPPDAPQPAKSTQAPTAQQAKKPVETSAQSAPPPAAAVAGQKEEFHTLETEVYKILFSNRGGVVRSWQLKKYTDSQGKPLEVVNSNAAQKADFPLSFAFESQKPSVDLTKVLFQSRPSADGLGIDFEYSDGRTNAVKRLQFQKDSYLSQINSEVRENGQGIPHMLSWRGGFGDISVPAAAASQKTFYFDQAANKLVENEVKVAESGPATVSGTYTFAGIEDTYFAAVFLAEDTRQMRLQTVSDRVSLKTGAGEEPVIGAAVGGESRNQFSFFLGPKDLDLLKRINPKLEAAIDFGWFTVIAKPLFRMLNWLNDTVFRNFGWSIIAATVLINLLLVPLKLSGMKSMRKMGALKPDIDEINRKYANLSFRDPKKQEQQAEVMALYKKNGVNPLNVGCMPLLVQIPFFFAFYKVLSMSIELRGADWLWVTDLSQPETIPIRILPLAMAFTQFLVQKMTPSTGADPSMQNMMLIMPFVMCVMFYGVSSGLVLYWLTGNLVGIAQQALINRTMPAPAVTLTSKPVLKKPRK